MVACWMGNFCIDGGFFTSLVIEMDLGMNLLQLAAIPITCFLLFIARNQYRWHNYSFRHFLASRNSSSLSNVVLLWAVEKMIWPILEIGNKTVQFAQAIPFALNCQKHHRSVKNREVSSRHSHYNCLSILNPPFRLPIRPGFHQVIFESALCK